MTGFRKKTAQMQLLLWLVSCLAFAPQASFSGEQSGNRTENRLESEKSVPAGRQSHFTGLYTVKLHYEHKRTGIIKSSEHLVYAAFDQADETYVVVCHSEEEQYKDAHDRCEALRVDANLGHPVKIAALSGNTDQFSASAYRDQNRIWRLLSYFYKLYSVNLDALFPRTPPGDMAREKPATESIQKDEYEEHLSEVVAPDQERGVSEYYSLSPVGSGHSETNDYTCSGDYSGSRYSFFTSGRRLGGVAALMGGAGFALYYGKWMPNKPQEQSFPSPSPVQSFTPPSYGQPSFELPSHLVSYNKVKSLDTGRTNQVSLYRHLNGKDLIIVKKPLNEYDGIIDHNITMINRFYGPGHARKLDTGDGFVMRYFEGKKPDDDFEPAKVIMTGIDGKHYFMLDPNIDNFLETDPGTFIPIDFDYFLPVDNFVLKDYHSELLFSRKGSIRRMWGASNVQAVNYVVDSYTAEARETLMSQWGNAALLQQ